MGAGGGGGRLRLEVVDCWSEWVGSERKPSGGPPEMSGSATWVGFSFAGWRPKSRNRLAFIPNGPRLPRTPFVGRGPQALVAMPKNRPTRMTGLASCFSQVVSLHVAVRFENAPEPRALPERKLWEAQNDPQRYIAGSASGEEECCFRTELSEELRPGDLGEQSIPSMTWRNSTLPPGA